MRLNKFIAHCGICSRRDADKLIAAGSVYINGALATPGMDVSEGDDVRVNNEPIHLPKEHVVLAYYKPVGVTCTERDPHALKTVAEAIDYPGRVTYAGRLDVDSEGLLLLTDDGDLIHALMSGSKEHEKEYSVTIDRPVTGDFLEKMSGGLYLPELDVTTRPCKAIKTGEMSFNITLTQGLNRQIRRMCEVLGARVLSLKRIRVENITLKGLGQGEYRELTGGELEELKSRLWWASGNLRPRFPGDSPR